MRLFPWNEKNSGEIKRAKSIRCPRVAWPRSFAEAFLWAKRFSDLPTQIVRATSASAIVAQAIRSLVSAIDNPEMSSREQSTLFGFVLLQRRMRFAIRQPRRGLQARARTPH
jgi:hypothetical protein